MNKQVFGWIILFSLISSIFLFVAVLLWGINNDYVLFEVNEQAQSLANSSIITNTSAASAEASGNAHANLNFYFDFWWLGNYISLWIATVAVSYFSREEEYFSFLGLLFFGTMFILFIIAVIYPLTEWWVNDLLYKILPGLQGTLPMFDHYNDNVGIYSFIHLLVCIFANRMYFRINDNFNKKNTDLEEIV